MNQNELTRGLITVPCTLLFVLLFAMAGFSQEQPPTLDELGAPRLIVVRTSPTAAAELIQAASLEEAGGRFIVKTMDEKTKVVEPSMIRDHFPMPGAPNAPEPSQAINELRKAQVRYPGLTAALETSIETWKQAEKEEIDKKAQMDAQAAEKKWKSFQTDTHNPSSTYTKSDLKRKVKTGEELLQAFPDRAEEIQTILVPWKEELRQIEAGMVKFDGAWVKPQDIPALQAEKQKKTVKTSPKKEMRPIASSSAGTDPLDTVAVPQSTILLVGGVALVSLFFLGLSLVQGILRVTKKPDIVGIGTLAFGTVGMLVYAYFGILSFIPPSDLPAKPDTNNPQRTRVHQLRDFARGESDNTDETRTKRHMEIGQDEVNAYLQQAVKWKEKSKEPMGVSREGFLVRFTAKEIIVFEKVRFLGRTWVLSHRITYSTRKDGFMFENGKVYLGSARLPNNIGRYFWKRTYDDLKAMLDESRVLVVYSLREINHGKVTFQR